MMKPKTINSLILTILFVLFLFIPEAKSQLYEAKFIHNKAVISYSDNRNDIDYVTENMLSGFNRKKERFIYKIPIDTLLSNLTNRQVETGSPFEKNYLTLYIQPKSHPIDLDNFDGESLELECEIAYNGRNYNETAQFKAFFNDDDRVITTSFTVRIKILDRDWFDIPPEWGEYSGEIDITATEALVPVKTEY